MPNVVPIGIREKDGNNCDDDGRFFPAANSFYFLFFP
jgi:hypothetical protein